MTACWTMVRNYPLIKSVTEVVLPTIKRRAHAWRKELHFRTGSILTVTFGQASKALFALLRHVDFIRKKSFSVSFYLGKEERFDTCSDSRHDAILKYDIKGKLESNANNSGIKLAPCTRNVIYSLCDLHCLIFKCLN